jgi:hypothetical protein
LHIAASTEKNPPKSAGCGILGKAPWADRWHIAVVTARYANGRPNHCAKCHSRQIRCLVVAKFTGSDESVFTSMDVVPVPVLYTLQSVALRRPIFKQKKGSATISLDLNYCSMGSSHSLSRETVPLMFWLDVFFFDVKI